MSHELVSRLRSLRVLLGIDSPETRGWAPAVQREARRVIDAAINALSPAATVCACGAGALGMGHAQNCQNNHTLTGLMELVSEHGQCCWSEGSSGATYLDRMGERRSREEAADLYKQIEAYASALADGAPSPIPHPLPAQANDGGEHHGS